MHDKIEPFDPGTTTSEDNGGRPPWSWAALTLAERSSLAKSIDDYVGYYNEAFAISPNELIPPCWPLHAGLAAELAAHFWLWVSTHAEPTARPESAVAFYEIHLPRFRQHVTKLLGEQATECQAGQHGLGDWRTREIRGRFAQTPVDAVHAAQLLGARNLGLRLLTRLPGSHVAAAE